MISRTSTATLLLAFSLAAAFQAPAPTTTNKVVLQATNGFDLNKNGFNGANGVNGKANGSNGYQVNSNDFVPMRAGSSVAVVTPMKANGDLDLPALEILLQWHVDQGTDNLCILGTTGEANTMTMEERKAVLSVAVKVCKGKMPILAGCGTIDPHHVKDMTQQALDLGCDASLVVTPYYVKPPQRGLVRHFLDAADLGLPVVVYNVPGRSGVNVCDETMTILAQHDMIVGLKDATGDLERLQTLKAAFKEAGIQDNDVLLYSGDDGTSKDYVLQGGDGCISVTANVAPNQMHKLMQACLNGDEKLATEINTKLEPLHSNLFCEANPIPAKWAVHRMGYSPSPICRPPLDAMDEQYIPIVEQAMKDAGVLDQAKTTTVKADAAKVQN